MIHVGDALTVLGTMPTESVQCVVTSPPYWGLRDYGTASWTGGDAECDHLEPRGSTRGGPHSTITGGQDTSAHAGAYRDSCGKCGATRIDSQLGLEATPQEYVARMVEVFRQVRRVLRKDGTVFLNLGDSYAGSWGAQSRGGAPSDASTLRGNGHVGGGPKAKSLSAVQIAAHPRGTRTGSIPEGSGLKPKDLVGIPWRVAFALQADGWYLRSDIIWSKPNPMPESVTDRPTKAHEYLFLLTRSERYYYDAEAIQEPVSLESLKHFRQRPNGTPTHGRLTMDTNCGTDPAGRNKRTVWTIATQPYPEAHFATYPEALVEPCILAGTSAKGCCPECGAPWERVVERSLTNTEGWGKAIKDHHVAVQGSDAVSRNGQGRAGDSSTSTLGWRPTCLHGFDADNDWSFAPEPVACTVLDPFAGSGTTLAVAKRLDRDYIGIELNPARSATPSPTSP